VKLAAALLSILATTASSAPSTTRDVADIVRRHVAAIGGQDAVRSLHDFELRLIYTEGTFSAQSSLAQARPYFRLVRVPAGPLTKDSVLEGYDGAAWEYYGDPGVVLRTVGSAGAIARRNAHQFIDPLVDAADNRTTLKYLGDRVVGRKSVSTVSARFSDGTIYLVFVDRTTYLIDGFAENIQRHAFGKTVATHTAMDDYRPVGGVMMPFRARQIDDNTGKVLNSSVTTSARANVGLLPSYFAPPTFTPTPLQSAIATIYDDRDDPAAVAQAYEDYRELFGNVPPTLDAINFIGYQCLKMGAATSAIALLAANVRDNEGSASAHFSLGRAFATAGKIRPARAEFKLALKLDPTFKRAADALKELPK
jgi:hypothetical protein